MSDDIDKKRLLADAADDLRKDQAFMEALRIARARTVDDLVACKSTEEKIDLVAKLKCLTQIASELTVLVNNYRQAARRQANVRGPGTG